MKHTRRRHLRQLLGVTAALALPLMVTACGDQHKNHNASGHMGKEQKPWGIAGDTQQAERTVIISMGDDLRFAPSHLDVKLGETLRLRAENKDQVMHQIVIGTSQELKEHAEMMEKHPNMEHDEPYMARVSPGQASEIVWTFNREGNFEFVCLMPGHLNAGMRGTIHIRA